MARDKIVISQKQPKPCPVCYTPMRLTGKVWACDKHGIPTRP